jgi:RHS repeat-associated protein
MGGELVHRAGFKPYGEDLDEGIGSFVPKYQFNFKEKETSGLYDYGARLYNPATGRWMSADTVLDGLNRYAYVGNNPLRYIDPTGHDRQDVMYSPNSDVARWMDEMRKRFGPEVGQSVINGVFAIDDAARNNECILFLAQGAGNPKVSDNSNRLTWQNHTKIKTIAMVNSNGLVMAANGKSNNASAAGLAYLLNHALGKNVKASDMVLGTHSNGANVLNEALGILKNTHGRSLSGSTALIMAPATSVSTIYSIVRQVGNSQVAVFDSVRDPALMAAGMSGTGKSSINYNHISRNTRPDNVHFYVVNLPWSALPSPGNNFEGLFNHNVLHYFNAIEAGHYWEYKP